MSSVTEGVVMAELSWIQRKRARKMLRQNTPIERVARTFGVTPAEIDVALEQLREYERKSRAENNREAARRTQAGPLELMQIIPDEVAEDRRRRSLARDGASLSGRLLGDPPPGFSALERAKAAPEKIRDPLAVLLYRAPGGRTLRGARYG